MKLDLSHWVYGLFAALIGGGEGSISPKEPAPAAPADEELMRCPNCGSIECCGLQCGPKEPAPAAPEADLAAYWRDVPSNFDEGLDRYFSGRCFQRKMCADELAAWLPAHDAKVRREALESLREELFRIDHQERVRISGKYHEKPGAVDVPKGEVVSYHSPMTATLANVVEIINIRLRALAEKEQP